MRGNEPSGQGQNMTGALPLTIPMRGNENQRHGRGIVHDDAYNPHEG